ncbi:DNA-directed DNA polymerase [Limnohabitans sp.]|uniref:Y-family DNA polymerase n=1 Tax=Limnohabitans sp. TaxID=1907725 RepID=UPI00286EC1B9|nr:DNA-directed DNA polymerase [Limnohabitans sp.]
MLRSLFVDFNSYFASVEQQLNPALRGRPVGVVPVLADTSCCIAASYEAKALGIGTGTGVAEARQLCPDIAIVLADHAKYVEMHHRAVAVVDTLAPVRQVLSIDEMECELTGRWQQRERAVGLAERIKAEVVAQLGECMRTSVGIAPNTLLAKLASNMQKPDGLTVIEAHELPQRLYGLKPKAINGIGPRMVQRLERCGIHTMAQLYAAPRELLRTAWGGVAGAEMYDKLRGQWYGPRETVAKSLGHSHVLPPDLRNPAGAFAVLNRLTQKAAMRLRKQNVYATSLSVHVRCRHGHGRGGPKGLMMGGDRAAQIGETQDTAFLLHTLEILWNSGLHLLAQPVTVGVQLHGLIEAGQHTGDLFGFDEAAADAAGVAPDPAGSLSARTAQKIAPVRDRRKLLAAIDTLNGKHGKNTVYFASAQAGLDHAPMRIAFNRIPDLASER